jgi:mRNA interferase RelE/StbE
MADVLLHPDVEKTLQNLSNDVEERIRDKLEDAGGNPDFYLDGLSNSEKYKLRIGKRRAIIRWNEPDDQLLVDELDTRDTVYDR